MQQDFFSWSFPQVSARYEIRLLMNRQRLFSILWAIEFIVGLLPAIVVLGMSGREACGSHRVLVLLRGGGKMVKAQR